MTATITHIGTCPLCGNHDRLLPSPTEPSALWCRTCETEGHLDEAHLDAELATPLPPIIEDALRAIAAALPRR